MKIVVLDTNVLIDNVYGFNRWLDTLLDDPDNYKLIISTIVVAEYLTAQEHETQEGRDKSRNYLSTFKIQDFDYGIAEQLGKILRRKTYVPGASLADLIIAATTLELDGFLATRNKADFAKIPNLRFFDPKQLN